MAKLPFAEVSRRIKMLFVLIRWIFILACLGFVAYGWKNSVTKYLARQISVGTIVNETLQFRFPSVTICPGFRNKSNLVTVLQGMKNKSGLVSIDKEGTMMKKIIEEFSYRRQDFLTLFSQADLADVTKGTGVLLNDSLWTESVHHQYYSGKCFTYDPPFKSKAAEWNGIRIGLKQRARGELVPESRACWDHIVMDIFLHDKGEFQYSRADVRPKTTLIVQDFLHYNEENIIQINYGTFTSLSTSEKPCSDEPGYSMGKCVTEFYSQLRGCQPPWAYVADSSVRMCTDIQEISKLFNISNLIDESFPWVYDGSYQLRSSLYHVEPTYRSLADPGRPPIYQALDNGSDWVLNLYFKDFKFTHEKEFLVCDFTCLLGEIGGNLGFFLGGSFLAYLDLVLKQILRIVSK